MKSAEGLDSEMMAAKVERVPERLSPADQSGRLILSEHSGRYLWAAQLASGMNVLDAGCGTGYGAQILAGAGASRVIGVDVSETAIAEAAQYRNPLVEFSLGDLTDLPFSDCEFDFIVCFEVIEHVENRNAVLKELRRVLTADGLLCISTPNSRVYPSGNPHHLHEYEPEEFARALSTLFTHVELHRQSAWLGSGILSDREFTKHGITEQFPARVAKHDSQDSSEEIFTVALASSHSLPSTESTFVLGDPFEVRWWQDQIDMERTRAEAKVNEARRQLHQANQAVSRARAESIDSAGRLLDVEKLVAGLHGRVYALEEELSIRSDRIESLSDRAERGDSVIEGMKNSISWRITRPLRALKRSR